MLIPTFRISLSNPVQSGLVCVGKFDGRHPSLAVATSTDNILIHSPHHNHHANHSKSDTQFRQLAVNRKITAISSGDLECRSDERGGRELLLVGTSTNLLAYDVEDNQDIFFKEVPDGVNALVFGTMYGMSSPVAVVGGNCSIQAFNGSAQEMYWTVTSDNVTALAFRDIPTNQLTNDNSKDPLQAQGQGQQLLVGCEDFEIRIFQQEDVLFEATESDVITGLSPLRGGTYGYSLVNGTIGVYNNTSRLWHAKSKHRCSSLASFDLDGDGVPELVAGWSNGRIEVRREQDGDLIYKDKFNVAVAALCVADYRMEDKTEIIAVAENGEIRGYLPAEPDEGGTSGMIDSSVTENALQALYDKKQELLAELKSYENNMKQMKTGKVGSGVIPANTKLSLALKPNKLNQALMLTLSTNNDTVIKMAMVFSELIFEDESKVVHPLRPNSTLSIPIKPEKQGAMNTSCELLIKAVVGHRSSVCDHVFEMVHVLPRFSSFVYCKPRDISPRGIVTFNTSERVNRVVLWISSAFAIDDKQPLSGVNLSVTSDSLHAGFVSIRDGSPLIIKMGPEHGGQINIKTDNMELAGDIVQDLAKYLKIEHLESVADFPNEMESFAQVLAKVEDFNAARLRLQAEMADTTNQVKNIVIKAEDARLLNQMDTMVDHYSDLQNLNRELIGEYNKRANNHSELLKALKEVNFMIQKAARLRMGDAKAKVVTACRKAIKTNNIQSLFKIIKLGHAG